MPPSSRLPSRWKTSGVIVSATVLTAPSTMTALTIPACLLRGGNTPYVQSYIRLGPGNPPPDGDYQFGGTQVLKHDDPAPRHPHSPPLRPLQKDGDWRASAIAVISASVGKCLFTTPVKCPWLPHMAIFRGQIGSPGCPPPPTRNSDAMITFDVPSIKSLMRYPGNDGRSSVRARCTPHRSVCVNHFERFRLGWA